MVACACARCVAPQGERPLQLNYSRAFGAPALKKYGLSCQPAICQLPLRPEDQYVAGRQGLGRVDICPVRTVLRTRGRCVPVVPDAWVLCVCVCGACSALPCQRARIGLGWPVGWHPP